MNNQKNVEKRPSNTKSIIDKHGFIWQTYNNFELPLLTLEDLKNSEAYKIETTKTDEG